MLETLRKLASVLDIPTMCLVGEDREDRATPMTTDLWQNVRETLEHPGEVDGRLGEDEPTVAGVQRAFKEAAPLFDNDQYAELAAVLPPLLRDADALGTDGRSVRTRLLQLAGNLMVQTRQYGAADIALARAIEESDDQLEAAATVCTQCWLLVRQGKLDTALELAVQWADDTEPRLSRATRSELSTWGLLCIWISAAAVRNNDKETAADALRLAQAAAVTLGREHPGAGFSGSFGPRTVHLKRTESYGILDQPDVVLRLAERTPVTALRPSSDRNRHMLDIAHAHAKKGQFTDSFERLEQLRYASPEWLPHQQYARDIFTVVLNGRRTLTPEMRTMADFLKLPF